jgi:hypothetical protein
MPIDLKCLTFNLTALTNEPLESGMLNLVSDGSQTYLKIMYEILFVSQQLKNGNDKKL